jgi:predicted nucleotidyltransferase
MQLELQRVFHREVDLISKRALERSTNWVRRDEIMNSAQVLFSDEASYATR